MEPLSTIELNTIHTALTPVFLGELQGGPLDDGRPLVDTTDFLDLVNTDLVLKNLVEGRTPRELGIALVHITETYETKVIK